MADIKIHNLYYMLSYAYQSLRQQGYAAIAPENFENVHNLLAAILVHGVTKQLKRGLHREYVPQKEELAVARGQIHVGESIRRQAQLRRRMVCSFDEYTPDAPHNRILKCTMLLLLRQGDLLSANRKALRRLLAYFGDVGDISPSSIRFGALHYHRNNAEYRMLMELCMFVCRGLLLTTQAGEHRLSAWVQDEAMHRLYEKFILAYYQRHHAGLSPKAAYIDWDITSNGGSAFLPSMRSDVVLANGDKTLIIDAKYYSRTMTAHYDRQRYHSDHLYQIYAYVKNRDTACDGSVSGVLLYAKTEEEITPHDDFVMGGNRISLRTLDLNSPWNGIAQQLDDIALLLEQTS